MSAMWSISYVRSVVIMVILVTLIQVLVPVCPRNVCPAVEAHLEWSAYDIHFPDTTRKGPEVLPAQEEHRVGISWSSTLVRSYLFPWFQILTLFFRPLGMGRMARK
jgi:hypothetical protein